VSANRTVVHLVTAQPVGGAELADPGLDLTLQCLEPGELVSIRPDSCSRKATTSALTEVSRCAAATLALR